MLEFYLDQLRKNIKSNPEIIKSVFLKLIKHFDINKLKILPDFNDIKKIALEHLTKKEVFSHVAIPLVRQNKYLPNLRFLIEECLLNFKKLRDKQNNSTLLHIACLYGSTDIARYLLEKGFNVNAQDSSGGTPAHYVVQFANNTPLIALLKKYNANLNTTNKIGMAPLHLAALCQNFSAITELKKQGANLKLNYCDESYQDLSRGIKNGQIIASHLPILYREENWEFEIQSNNYYEIWQPKPDKKNFNNIIERLINNPKPLSQEEVIILVDSYVLTHFTSSFDLNIFQQFILDQIKQNKLSLSNALIAISRTARFFSRDNFPLLVVKLIDIACVLTNNQETQSTDTIQQYNAIVMCCNQVGAFQKAEELSLKALHMISDETDKTTRSYVFYNLACSQSNQGKMDESDENYRLSFEYLKNDTDILRSYLTTLFRKGKYSEATIACQSSNCGDFTRVAQVLVSYLAGDLSNHDTLKAIEKDCLHDVEAQSYILYLRSICYTKLKDYDKALAMSKAGFEYEEQHFQSNYNSHYAGNMNAAITSHLLDYIKCREYRGALIFMQECITKYSAKCSNYLPLMVYATIIYTANQHYEEAEAFINKIENINPKFFMLPKLYLQLGVDHIDNLSVASHYFDLALKCDADNRLAKLYKILVQLLMRETPQQEIASDNVIDIIDNFAAESSEEENATDYESKISQYDLLKIHQYFQTQKQQIRLDLCSNLTPDNFQSKIQWKIKDSMFTEEDINLHALNSDFYPGYYSVIDPQLKMDEKILERFQIALKKGICGRQLGQNGIKFLKNSVIELKIDDNIRLYTTAIYKNSNNKCLILFNKSGNHECIKKLLLKKKPLKTIELTECKNEQIPISKFHGGLFANKTQPEQRSSYAISNNI